MKQIETDICIIGGGSGGLSLAAGAVQMGARVVLFEGGQMGGDCLNSGCVPSKALLAAAKAAYLANGNAAMGITNTPPNIDFAAVKVHVCNKKRLPHTFKKSKWEVFSYCSYIKHICFVLD